MACTSLGTPEQESKFRSIMASLKGGQGAVMPAMQQAQELYGYLPFPVQKFIAEELEVPLEEIYGIATFYSQFSLTPKGRNSVSVCLGTACYVKGAKEIHDRLSELLGIGEGEVTKDGKFSLDSCRCVGACGLAPVMMIDGDVYGRLTPDEVDGILKKY